MGGCGEGDKGEGWGGERDVGRGWEGDKGRGRERDLVMGKKQRFGIEGESEGGEGMSAEKDKALRVFPRRGSVNGGRYGWIGRTKLGSEE